MAGLALLPETMLGKDGPLYLNSLKLDQTCNVPPPGNIGWVLCGKVLTTLGFAPITAFGLVGIAITVVGAVHLYLLCALFMRPQLAAIAALGVALSPLVWYHSPVLTSYIVWMGLPPTIAYYGIRSMREKRLWQLHVAVLATGLGTILRPHMLVFASPLLGMMLLLSRAPIVRGWLISAAICAACCRVCFFGTAAVLEGVDKYLEVVRAKHEFHEGFGMKAGLVEGLMRNGSKFGLLYIWGCLFAFLPAAVGCFLALKPWRTTWMAMLIGLAAIGPSLYFSFFVFMGNAGLVLPAIVLSFVLAAWAMETAWAQRKPNWPIIGMSIVATLGVLQFLLAPIPEPRNQRDVVLTVIFSKYSGAGIRKHYNYNMTDFKMDPSLRNVLKQIRHPEPVPYIPPYDPFNPPEGVPLPAPPTLDAPQYRQTK